MPNDMQISSAVFAELSSVSSVTQRTVHTHSQADHVRCERHLQQLLAYIHHLSTEYMRCGLIIDAKRQL